MCSAYAVIPARSRTSLSSLRIHALHIACMFHREAAPAEVRPFFKPRVWICTTHVQHPKKDNDCSWTYSLSVYNCTLFNDALPALSSQSGHGLLTLSFSATVIIILETLFHTVFHTKYVLPLSSIHSRLTVVCTSSITVIQPSSTSTRLMP